MPMKWLVGVLLVVVALEATVLVFFQLRLDRIDGGESSGPPDGGAAAPATLAQREADSPSTLQTRIEELASTVAGLQSQIDAIRGNKPREPVLPPVVTSEYLESQEFRARIGEYALETIKHEEERRRLLAFEEKVPQFAQAIIDRWPLRYGGIDDLEAVLQEWYPRMRTIWLEYTPDGKQLTETDPRRAARINEVQLLRNWAGGELQLLYGVPLAPELRQYAEHLVKGYASPWEG